MPRFRKKPIEIEAIASTARTGTSSWKTDERKARAWATCCNEHCVGRWTADVLAALAPGEAPRC